MKPIAGLTTILAAALILLSNGVAAETIDHSAHQDRPASAADDSKSANTLTLSGERLQSIGVKFEEAMRRPVEKPIRTVGRVEMDERLQARVNIKIEGWIDRLFVNTTGEKVKKGQLLFTLTCGTGCAPWMASPRLRASAASCGNIKSISIRPKCSPTSCRCPTSSSASA